MMTAKSRRFDERQTPLLVFLLSTTHRTFGNIVRPCRSHSSSADRDSYLSQLKNFYMPVFGVRITRSGTA
jgi:hypothetical protein